MWSYNINRSDYAVQNRYLVGIRSNRIRLDDEDDDDEKLSSGGYVASSLSCLNWAMYVTTLLDWLITNMVCGYAGWASVVLTCQGELYPRRCEWRLFNSVRLLTRTLKFPTWCMVLCSNGDMGYSLGELIYKSVPIACTRTLFSVSRNSCYTEVQSSVAQYCETVRTRSRWTWKHARKLRMLLTHSIGTNKKELVCGTTFLSRTSFIASAILVSARVHYTVVTFIVSCANHGLPWAVQLCRKCYVTASMDVELSNTVTWSTPLFSNVCKV